MFLTQSMAVKISICLENKYQIKIINKKSPLCAGLGSNRKTLRNCQAAYQKQLCLKIQTIFFFDRVNIQIGLTPLTSSFSFSVSESPPHLHWNIMFNSSNCIIVYVGTCCFVKVNRDIFSCTNFNVYYHEFDYL